MNLSVVFCFWKFLWHWYQIEGTIWIVLPLKAINYTTSVWTPAKERDFIFVHTPWECLYVRKLCFKRFHVYLGTTTFCICHKKVRNLHLRCYLMWPRWYNFLIMLQCSICSLHRENNNKKSNYLPALNFI